MVENKKAEAKPTPENRKKRETRGESGGLVKKKHPGKREKEGNQW